MNETDIVFRLRKRAEIRRQIPGRKSVQAGEKDRIAELLDEAAEEIVRLRGECLKNLSEIERMKYDEKYKEPNPDAE